MPVTPTQSTPIATPVPTLSATQSTASTPLQPALVGNNLFTLAVALAVTAFVLVVIALVTVVAVCVKARRSEERDKLAMMGSGAFVTPLLDRPTTAENQVDSTNR